MRTTENWTSSRKDVRADKVEELSEGYARRDPDAVTLINECLVAARSEHGLARG